MFRNVRLAAGMLFLLVRLPLLAQGPGDWAAIEGRVLDSQNRPISEARISVLPMDGFSGTLPTAQTNKDGKYRLNSPPLGRTRLCAVKESEGYPDTQDLLFASGQEVMPEVNLTPKAYLYDIDIHLGSPDGTLEGVVVDAITGSPIARARLTLHRKVPESMYSTSLEEGGHFAFALPSVPIEITVTAPGYIPWKYSDPVTGVNSIVIAASDHRIVKVSLKPQ
jgi:hypothetical protein